MSIEELFKALENDITKKKPLLGGGNGDGMRILAELKSKVGKELNEAAKITAARDTILKSADESARKTVEEAVRKSDEMLMRSDHVKNAEEKADEIMTAAVKKQGEVMRNFAIYLDSKLCECEKSLASMLEEIRTDRAKLFPQ